MSTSFDTSLTKISSSHESGYASEVYQGVQSKRDGSTPPNQTGTTQDLQPFRITISEDALRKAGLLKDKSKAENSDNPKEAGSATNMNDKTVENPQEALELENLKRTDREVRAHEQAHVIAGGNLVRGAASFGYATGPDGRLYAVSGEVSIDSSPVQDDPEATIRKMRQVVRAALAPARPSGQDRAVASAAIKTQVEAQQQVTHQQMEKVQSSEQSVVINIKA
ncbi:MAG: hypothetical protein HY864_00525 [Chloroflexi bacterium]|nr:hypothetical protein [Chloroflexota bacterium]